MTYQQALDYIHNNSWTNSAPGLSRISKLLELLGRPQKQLRFIHVAGTNGKGSFCSILSEILVSAGMKVGRFTSPYIKRFNDRICINGKEIPDNDLARLTEYVKPYAETLAEKATEFELICAIGMLYFLDEKCDVVILEAGLGGRLDSTNVIDSPDLSVITSIDYDHTAILGDTLEKIASEKAGIIKEGSPVLVGDVSGTVKNVIVNKAKDKNAPVFFCDYTTLNIKEFSLEGTVFDYLEHEDLHLSLLGEYQTKNAALAISAANLVQERYSIRKENIYEGVKNAVWNARFEVLDKSIPLIYDGGHNPQGVRECVKSIKKYFKDQKVILITSMMKDKEYKKMIELFSSVTDKAYIFRANERAEDAKTIATLFSENNVTAYDTDSLFSAYISAKERSKETGAPILCAGSLYIYEQFIKLM